MTSQTIIAFLNPVATWFIGSLLLVLWLHHPHRRHIILFSGGFFFGGLAFAIRDLGVTFGIVSITTSRLLANGLFLGTTLALSSAVLVFYRQRVPVAVLAVLSLAGAGPFLWYLLVTDDLVARAYAVHLTLAALVAVTFIRVIPVQRGTVVDRAILFGGAASIINLLLPLAFLGIAGSTVYWTMSVVTSVLLAVILSLIFLVVLAVEMIRSIRQEARIDGLSRLPDRRGFEEALAEVLAHAPDGEAALILMDIDHFKDINDGYGHAVGDEVIGACGALLAGVASGDVRVGRVGGEEFTLYVPAGGLVAAGGLAEELRVRLMDLPVSTRVPDLRITASFGVAPARPGDDMTGLLARADAALYVAKRSGRNRVQMSEAAVSRIGEGDPRRRRLFRDRDMPGKSRGPQMS